MIPNFKDYTNTQPSEDQREFDNVKIEPLGIFEPRMMIFENYWNSSFFTEFNNQSIKPFLENLNNLIGEPLTVGHRFISSLQDLQYYLKNPGGVAWNNPEFFNVIYFSFHGSQLGFPLAQGLIGKADILEMCNGFKDFPNILLYFGSCFLFENDDQFGYDLLTKGAPGVRGVLGYQKNVPFSVGTILDLFFLSSFFTYKDGDPFANIEKLFSDVIIDFPLAREVGFTLYC